MPCLLQLQMTQCPVKGQLGQTLLGLVYSTPVTLGYLCVLWSSTVGGTLGCSQAPYTSGVGQAYDAATGYYTYAAGVPLWLVLYTNPSTYTPNFTAYLVSDNGILGATNVSALASANLASSLTGSQVYSSAIAGGSTTVLYTLNTVCFLHVHDSPLHSGCSFESPSRTVQYLYYYSTAYCIL